MTVQVAKDATLATTGVVAAGNAHAPNDVYSEWLLTHGWLALSYAEWLKVLGGLYVALLIFKMIGGFKLARWIGRKILAKHKR